MRTFYLHRLKRLLKRSLLTFILIPGISLASVPNVLYVNFADINNSQKDLCTVFLNKNSTHKYDKGVDIHLPENKVQGGFAVSTWSSNEKPLSINAIPYAEEGTVVPLSYIASTNGMHKLTFKNLESFSNNIKLVLIDHAENAEIDIRKNRVYTFKVKHANGKHKKDRFSIRFEKNKLSNHSATKKAGLEAAVSQVEVVANVQDDCCLNVKVDKDAAKDFNVSIMNETGQIFFSGWVKNLGENNIHLHRSLMPGHYLMIFTVNKSHVTKPFDVVAMR